MPEKFEDDPVDDEDDDEDEDQEEETPEETPQETQGLDDQKPSEEQIANEVGLLQNDGIFRRELLMGIGQLNQNLQELIDVHKVNTQTLIDLKKIAGGENAKEKN